MNSLMEDFVRDMEGAELVVDDQQRKRKIDTDASAGAPPSDQVSSSNDASAPSATTTENRTDDGPSKASSDNNDTDTDSDHRGRKAVRPAGHPVQEVDDPSDNSSSSSSPSSSPGESLREDHMGDEEDVSSNTDTTSKEKTSSSSPPSPPPLPLHRHRPSAGARRTFDNLMAASDSSPSSTHRCTVIAAVVVFDGEGRVLLVQEAKAKCRGRWYLPAGRVEVGESPIEGAMREVEEESGLQLEPSGIFSVEYKINKRSGKAWIRYGVTGQIVGGSLKTPDREDKESIQAQWFPLDEVNASLGLRNDDMLKLIALHQQNGDRPVPVLSSYK